LWGRLPTRLPQPSSPAASRRLAFGAQAVNLPHC
jgi:hypothetical protein